MTAVLMIIGGAAGGFLGWLTDRRKAHDQPEAKNNTQGCETSA